MPIDDQSSYYIPALANLHRSLVFKIYKLRTIQLKVYQHVWELSPLVISHNLYVKG